MMPAPGRLRAAAEDEGDVRDGVAEVLGVEEERGRAPEDRQAQPVGRG